MADPSEFQIVHTLWTAAITVGGAIVAFFTKRLIDDVDQKADKSELTELKQTFKEFLERQDRQHQGNTDRLDKIIMELGNRDRTRRDRAEDRRS